jgi:L,D-peptidoglycan transpeptidase YkuD (ErfK/YbiS/YcfS/YnhG family)
MSCNPAAIVTIATGPGSLMKNRIISNNYNRRTRPLTMSTVTIRPAAGDRRRGWLTCGGLAIPVALGRGGILANKREGDGGTPRGTFRPRQLWWRADRHRRPRTLLPVRPIKFEDAWCEDPTDRRYNRPLWLKTDSGGDRLARADHLYDFIVEIDHNTRPRISGRGSAVFLHLARENYAPTAGCVSMTKAAILHLLRRLSTRTRIVIG